MDNEIMELEKSYKKAWLTTVVALAVLVVSAGYIAFRMMSNKAYYEKWKDYDDCGLA